jgi:hypothetical protein
MKNLLIVAFVFLLPSLAVAKVKSVKIFLIPWTVVTSISMSPEYVRTHAIVKVEISDSGLGPSVGYADHFVRWLDEASMKQDVSLPVSDIRLVVDVQEEDGSVSSFYACRTTILAAKSGKRRLIDDAFRAQLSSFYIYREWTNQSSEPTAPIGRGSP